MVEVYHERYFVSKNLSKPKQFRRGFLEIWGRIIITGECALETLFAAKLPRQTVRPDATTDRNDHL